MAKEVELKLEIAPESVAALLASGVLPGDPARLELRSVYFDTPARSLSQEGFSLRIRYAGETRIQTIKAAGAAAAGLYARPEWESNIDGDRPAIDDSTPLKSLLGAAARELAPLFEVRVERLVWDLPWQDARIEVALDRGEVRAGERCAGVCELELELKRGDVSSLFSLARRLDEVTPLRVGVLNKAERGFRLLGPMPGAAKSEDVWLPPKATARDAFGAVAASCIRQFRLNEPLIDRQRPEALHQARVALRRLRSALTIFTPIKDDEAFARFASEVRWLAGALGNARDLDVLRSSLALDDPRCHRLDDAQAQAYRSARVDLASRRARALLIDLCEWLASDMLAREPRDGDHLDMPAKEFAVAVLDRYRRKVKKRGRNLDKLSDEARHEVRKDAKKLRYGVEFFLALFPEKKRQRRARRLVKSLEALQDRLGRLNDMRIAGDVWERAGMPDMAASSSVAAEERKRCIGEAANAHEAFCDAKPFWR